MNAIRPPAPAHAKARIIGHVFLEADGSLSVTPTVRIHPDDEVRLRATAWRLGRWRTVNERLLAGLARQRRR